MRNPGVDQNFTDLAAVVQLRLRVAVFADGHQPWVVNFDSEVPALNRRELGATPRHPTISASVVKLLSSFASNEEFAGGSPAGCTNSRACGLTRIAEGPDSESGSLGGASPFMPTISRQLASAGIADPGDLKSPSLPGASPGLPTGVWFTGNSRPVRLKTEQPWECKSPHADHFGMSTGQASRATVLTCACLRASGASPRHSANTRWPCASTGA